MTMHSGIARTGTSFSLAILVTFGLFFFMQQMISTPEIRLAPDTPRPDINISPIRPDTEPVKTIKKPEPPKPVEMMEEPAMAPEPTPTDGINLNPTIAGPGTPDLPKQGTIGFVDGEVYAITAITPDYPRAAAQKGLSGYVVVGFTVDKTGAVIDAHVIESSSSLFDRSALRAIRKFKYKPKVVNGIPVAQNNLMYKFTFELQDDA